MRSPLQEKFQIVTPTKPEDGEPWVTLEQSRKNRGMLNKGVPQFQSTTSAEQDTNKFNYTPPGMEIENQVSANINSMPFQISGSSDVSKDVNPQAFEEGFKNLELKATDDQYTGEHVDHFYGDAGGFAERNNYLDRM